MSDIREMLADVEESIENPWKSANIRGLLAALRKALEIHWETCVCDEGPPYCRFVRKVIESLGGDS